jgi:hypothetical protein
MECNQYKEHFIKKYIKILCYGQNKFLFKITQPLFYGPQSWICLGGA